MPCSEFYSVKENSLQKFLSTLSEIILTKDQDRWKGFLSNMQLLRFPIRLGHPFGVIEKNNYDVTIIPEGLSPDKIEKPDSKDLWLLLQNLVKIIADHRLDGRDDGSMEHFQTGSTEVAIFVQEQNVKNTI